MGLVYEEAAPSLFQGMGNTLTEEQEEESLDQEFPFEMRFMSDEIALEIAEVTIKAEELGVLDQLGLKSQLGEAIIRAGGLMNTTNSLL